MNIFDTLQETYIALSANKIRTALTMLGIVIGISSVIIMVSIGAGAQSTIQSNIEALGSNLIIVTPGAQRGPGFTVSQGRGSARSLTKEDADAIKENVPGVSAVAADLSGRYQLTARGTNTNINVVGTNASYADIREIQIDQGSFVTDQNIKSLSKVVVLGPTVRDDLFGEGADALGQTVRIKNVQFKVIGIATSKGGSGFNNPDDTAYVPLSTAERFLAGDSYLSDINVQATDGEAMTDVQQGITDLLLDRHHITDPTLADFSTINQADIISAVSSVTQTFTILLAAVAGISLLVGGIGIMNMMLTTVTERTKEIGLRKAIGAKRRDINIQFLSESVALTFFGGLMGVVLGWAVSFGITSAGILETSVSLSSIILAFGVSAAIGIAFGYYPARRAASLNPIEALRYE